MSDLLALIGAMRRHFEQGLKQTDEIAAETKTVLGALSGFEGKVPSPLQPSAHAVLGHIARLNAENGGILEGEFAPVANLLPWRYGYDPRPDAPGLENAMAWAELVGPKAPIVSDEIGFGLTFISPHTHYLIHRHPAIELYNVVHGTALWSAAGRESERPAGSFILHHRNIVHAMRTTAWPMLAIYSWSGDIVSPSVWEQEGRR